MRKKREYLSHLTADEKKARKNMLERYRWEGMSPIEEARKKSRNRDYYEANKEQAATRRKAYGESNKDKIVAYRKSYRESNREKLAANERAYRESNKDKIAAYAKAYGESNKDKIAARKKAYYEANKEKAAAYAKTYIRERRKSDPLFAMQYRLRCRTAAAFRNQGYRKNTKTQETLGADWGVVKEHLESTFTEGMSWDNRELWHIDHIIPLASASNEEELIKLCHYTNLQALWAEDNLAKGDKIDWE